MRSIRFTAARACALAVCAAAAAALAGCANIGTSPAQSGSECRAVPASGEPQTIEMPDATADQLPDPRTVVGPTTAYTRSADITPVSDDPTADQSLPATVPSADGPQQKVTDTTRILALNQNGGLAAAVIGLGFGCNLVGRRASIASALSSWPPRVTSGRWAVEG